MPVASGRSARLFYHVNMIVRLLCIILHLACYSIFSVANIALLHTVLQHNVYLLYVIQYCVTHHYAIATPLMYSYE